MIRRTRVQRDGERVIVLIHVKRAEGSAPLSHLFSQGLISAQSLVAGPSAVRERFVKTVAELPHGRSLAADFKPTKVVYAILMPKGRELTPDTLFPFSQATLAHAARILGTYGIDVEAVGIPAA
ncbi:MAG TPA: TIGR04141 family sporadically distributed protein [Streptosporangiaceae bacterium]|nr:TIGR04141 family sporadically distributed protein [Streptosporangiaceae bacterium]